MREDRVLRDFAQAGAGIAERRQRLQRRFAKLGAALRELVRPGQLVLHFCHALLFT
jgi:hypothetical protein